MSDREKRGERTVALALLGAVLFSTPLLSGFDSDDGQFLFGIPALYLYLFAAWGLLIALLALAVESAEASSRRPGEPPRSKERHEADRR